MLAAASAGCVKFEGMPTMPTGSSSSLSVYTLGKKRWAENVDAGRVAVRSAPGAPGSGLAGFPWRLVGTENEQLMSAARVRGTYAGVIYVGDSQIREVAWAGLSLLGLGAQLKYAKSDPVLTRSPRGLDKPCVPQTVGKTGFTATCAETPSLPCSLHSPWSNKSHAEHMRKLLLTRPHDWDGTLHVPAAACNAAFFVSYQATWGAIPLIPDSLPACMRAAQPAAENGRYACGRKPRVCRGRKPRVLL